MSESHTFVVWEPSQESEPSAIAPERCIVESDSPEHAAEQFAKDISEDWAGEEALELCVRLITENGPRYWDVTVIGDPPRGFFARKLVARLPV